MTLRIERQALGDDGAAGLLTRLTLDRPSLGNSLSAALVDALDAALARCATDGTRVVLIDADGPNFCTGFDLSSLDEETDDSLLARFVRVELMLQRLWRLPCLTVAVAHGRAWGAGADLFAACGERWITDAASVSFPGGGFGLVLGTGRLAERVGAACAARWVATGARIDARTAIQTGLATRSLGDDGPPLAQALALAGATRHVDPGTLADVRRAAARREAADDALDLAQLVRSAARPGLADRIRAYRAASRRP